LGPPFGLKCSAFYMHIYADQSATFGPDTHKVLMKDLCDLLGEVGIICFLAPFSRLTFESRYMMPDVDEDNEDGDFDAEQAF
jgi:hypothetical protein